jgi:hypothetical protein
MYTEALIVVILIAMILGTLRMMVANPARPAARDEKIRALTTRQLPKGKKTKTPEVVVIVKESPEEVKKLAQLDPHYSGDDLY